jgi:hypothetical protein
VIDCLQEERIRTYRLGGFVQVRFAATHKVFLASHNKRPDNASRAERHLAIGRSRICLLHPPPLVDSAQPQKLRFFLSKRLI